MLPVTAQATSTAEKLKVIYFKLSWIFWREVRTNLPYLVIRKYNHRVVYSKASNLPVFIISFFFFSSSQQKPQGRCCSFQKLGAQEQLATPVSTPTSAISSRKVSSEHMHCTENDPKQILEASDTNPFSFSTKQKSLKCHRQLCIPLQNKQQADA